MEFTAVETQFKELKRQFEAGMLTEEDLRSQLQALMIQDQEGKWWMIGYESGQWHYHDGEQWVQSEPPAVARRRRDEADALYQKGVKSQSIGNWKAAVESFKAALALEPDHAAARAGLAEAEVRLEEVSKPAVQEESRILPAAPIQEESEELETAPTTTRPAIGEPGIPSAASGPEVKAEPKKNWGLWVVVAIVGVVIVVVLVALMGAPQGAAPEPEVYFWVDNQDIAPGDCTYISWETVGFETVHISGPGFDADQALPPGGKRKICPEADSGFELFHPDAGTLGLVEIRVQE